MLSTQILMTKCKHTRSIIHGWRLITLVSLASPARRAHMQEKICHTMPADDSVRKELTVVLYPYTKCKHVWKVGSRVQRNVICLYNDNHTTRAQGLALNARTSNSNKKERKSFLQKDTKHCLLFSVGKIQPAEHAQPPKEKTGLTCFVSSFP